MYKITLYFTVFLFPIISVVAQEIDRKLEYHENGRVAIEEEYVNGVLHGMTYHIDASGFIQEQHQYVNGKLDGTSIFYERPDPNNEYYYIQREITYNKGRKDGTDETYVYMDNIGTPIQVYTYENDTLHGYFLWYKDKLLYKGNYMNGQIDGEVDVYHKQSLNANKVYSHSIIYQDGLEIRTFRKSQ